MEDYTENLNSNSRDILSVSEVNQTADDFLRDIPPLWVSGEISGFKAYPSGHWYFSIKDSEARISIRIKDSLDNLRRNDLLIKINFDLENKLDLKKDEFKLGGVLILLIIYYKVYLNLKF